MSLNLGTPPAHSTRPVYFQCIVLDRHHPRLIGLSYVIPIKNMLEASEGVLNLDSYVSNFDADTKVDIGVEAGLGLVSRVGLIPYTDALTCWRPIHSIGSTMRSSARPPPRP